MTRTFIHGRTRGAAILAPLEVKPLAHSLPGAHPRTKTSDSFENHPLSKPSLNQLQQMLKPNHGEQ